MPYGGREAEEKLQRLLQAATGSQTLHSPSSGGVWGTPREGKPLTALLCGQGAPRRVGELLCKPLLESRAVRNMASECPGFQRVQATSDSKACKM